MAIVTKEEEEEVHLEVMEVRDEGKEQKTDPTKELEGFPLNNEHPNQVSSMNVNLDPEQKKAVMALICNHLSSFAWQLVDMSGISNDPQAERISRCQASQTKEKDV